MNTTTYDNQDQYSEQQGLVRSLWILAIATFGTLMMVIPFVS